MIAALGYCFRKIIHMVTFTFCASYVQLLGENTSLHTSSVIFLISCEKQKKTTTHKSTHLYTRNPNRTREMIKTLAPIQSTYSCLHH